MPRILLVIVLAKPKKTKGTSKLKLLQMNIGMAKKVKRQDWDGGRHTMYAKHVWVSQRGQYVHIGYITQALYCCIHVASADFTL